MRISFLHSDSDHQTVNMYTCNRCGKSFQKMSNLQRHFRRKTICERPEHRCYNCGNCLKNYRSLRDHLKRCPIKFEIKTQQQHYKCYKCAKHLANRHSLSRHKKSCNGNLLTTNIPMKDTTKYSNTFTFMDTPINTNSEEKKQEKIPTHSSYPPMLSHTINNYRKMDPSNPPQFHNKRPISIPPSLHHKEPIPISPHPGLLSSTKHSKSNYFNGFIPKNLDYDKYINNEHDNNIVMDNNPIIHNTMEYVIPTKSPATFLPETLDSPQKKLDSLLTEYETGNTSSRNEIMTILDKLRRDKSIGEEEYIRYNNRLNKENVKDIIDSTFNFLIEKIRMNYYNH